MKKAWVTLLTVLLMLTLPALADESVTVRSKNLRGYQENVLTVDCSAAGTLTLRVEDDFNVYHVLVEDMAVSAGKNTLIWDGLGYNQERLEDGKYRFHAELTTAEGENVTADVPFTLKKSRQALVFALSNGSTIYSDNEWFVEFKLIRKGRLVVEYYRADDMSKPFLTRKKSIDSAKTP